MEWRIRESSRGFYAEYGGYIKSGTAAEFKLGFYMPGFNVSESTRFDTKKQAENYIAIQNSICYHTREEASRYRQPKNPRTMCQHSPGILIFP